MAYTPQRLIEITKLAKREMVRGAADALERVIDAYLDGVDYAGGSVVVPYEEPISVLLLEEIRRRYDAWTVTVEADGIRLKPAPLVGKPRREPWRDIQPPKDWPWPAVIRVAQQNKRERSDR